MALSRSARRIAHALVGVGVSALAFAGVMLAPRTAHAQRVYVYTNRPAPPPYYGGGGYYGRPAQPYYYQEPPYQTQLGFDLEGVAPLNPPTAAGGPAAVGGGVGFKVRLGEEFRFPGFVRLTPEVGYAYDHMFAADNYGNSYAWDMNRLFLGARLGFGRILVPSVYAHIGYGWRQTDADYVTGGNGGVAFDFGGALDLKVVPHVTFGAHLEYAAISTNSNAALGYTNTGTAEWLALGGHINFLF
jgi:hypothetical protein